MAMSLGSGKPVNDINVTPLIDVVLVLLIIFMVLTPLAEKQMFMRVPDYEPPNQVIPPDAMPPDQTMLLVKADGRVLLNRQEKSVDEAMTYLKTVYDGHPSKVLFFNAEDSVKYDVAVRVIDMARQAGVNTIGMMTDAPSAAGAAAPVPAEGAPAPVAPGQ